MTNPIILMLGCFDTKAEIFEFLRSSIVEQGAAVISMDLGIMGTTDLFPVDIEADRVARVVGVEIGELREKRERRYALEVMAKGAKRILSGLLGDRKIHGVIGMGGGGGTFLALTAMQVLPLGFPKLCVSTLAAKDVSGLVGVKDVFLVPSVVDVADLNGIIQPIISQAATAIVSMGKLERKPSENAKARVAISMFGNTTECVNACTRLLKEKGFEVMAFHANGVGGKAMEALIREGVFDAVLDLTTTELADEFCGGILSAGSDRMRAAVDMGLPTVVAPGCLDMVNFGRPDTVPEKFRERKFYHWAPDVTLMRTDVAENLVLGKHIARTINPLKDRVAVVWPEKGFSQIGAVGDRFYDEAADKACLDGLTNELDVAISVVKIDASINQPGFAKSAVDQLLKLMVKSKETNKGRS